MNNLNLLSSDPEASLPLEVAGGQQGQLFNLATIAVGLRVPNVRSLSVSGCGLVAASALQKVDLQERLGNTPTQLYRFPNNLLTNRELHVAESSTLVSKLGIPSPHVL